MGKVQRFSTLGSKVRKLVFVGMVIYTLVAVVNQQLTLAKINKEIEEYTTKIQDVSDENTKHKETIERLQELDYIEMIARRELGLVRDKEKIYIFSR